MAIYKNKTGDTFPDITKLLSDTAKAVSAVGEAVGSSVAGAGAAVGSSLISGSSKLPLTGATRVEGSTAGADPVVTVPSVIKGAGEKPAQSMTASKAAERLSAWESSRPKDYSSAYGGEIRDLVSALTGMDFSYDPETDAVYKLVRDEIRKNARLAMEDTLGRSLSKTGGYSNSYGQMAAQSAYADELSKSVDYIPELYSAAYDRFEGERDALGESIELLTRLDESEFDKYTRIMKQYLDEGDMLLENYQWADEEEFDRFLDYAELLEKLARV